MGNGQTDDQKRVEIQQDAQVERPPNKRREDEDAQKRMHQWAHVPDTLERLLEEWAGENKDGTLAEDHRRSEDVRDRIKAGNQEEAKNNHRAQTLPPQEQATSSKEGRGNEKYRRRQHQPRGEEEQKQEDYQRHQPDSL